MILYPQKIRRLPQPESNLKGIMAKPENGLPGKRTRFFLISMGHMKTLPNYPNYPDYPNNYSIPIPSPSRLCFPTVQRLTKSLV